MLSHHATSDSNRWPALHTVLGSRVSWPPGPHYQMNSGRPADEKRVAREASCVYEPKQVLRAHVAMGRSPCPPARITSFFFLLSVIDGDGSLFFLSPNPEAIAERLVSEDRTGLIITAAAIATRLPASRLRRSLAQSPPLFRLRILHQSRGGRGSSSASYLRCWPQFRRHFHRILRNHPRHARSSSRHAHFFFQIRRDEFHDDGLRCGASP